MLISSIFPNFLSLFYTLSKANFKLYLICCLRMIPVRTSTKFTFLYRVHRIEREVDIYLSCMEDVPAYFLPMYSLSSNMAWLPLAS